jgi:hypothetical protein
VVAIVLATAALARSEVGSGAGTAAAQTST